MAVAGDEILGHAIYAREGTSTEAEFAIVVEDGWQSRGIGKLLLCELAAGAGRRGVEAFTGSVVGENRRALAAFAAVFPEMRFEMRGGEYQVRVPLRREAAAGRTAIEPEKSVNSGHGRRYPPASIARSTAHLRL